MGHYDECRPENCSECGQLKGHCEHTSKAIKAKMDRYEKQTGRKERTCSQCGQPFIGSPSGCPFCLAAEASRETLLPTEPHPAAEIARSYLVKHLSVDASLREALASCAIEGNRLAEVCLGTLRRIGGGEPVSDRYLMGLAWFVYSIDKETDKCGPRSKRKPRPSRKK